MKIKLNHTHGCIQSLEPVELPDFAVLIGRNGVGKTQLLEALDRGNAEASGIATSDVEFYDNNVVVAAKSNRTEPAAAIPQFS